MKKLYFVIALILAAININAQNIWEQIPGSFGQATPTAIAVNPENHLYAGFFGTFISGVHYSTDEGNTWTSISPDWDIINLALNQSGHIFISARDQGSLIDSVFRSTNNGNSWIYLTNAPNTVYSLVVNPMNDYLFIGSSDGVYRSVNNGDSWSQVNNGLPGIPGFDPEISLLAVSPGGVVFACETLQEPAIYRSEDDGNFWAKFVDGLILDPQGYNGVYVNSISISKSDVTYIYAVNVEEYKGVFRYSSIDTLLWEKRDYGLPNDFVYSFTTNSLGHVFAGTNVANAKVFRSINGGYFWHPVSEGLPAFGGPVLALVANLNDKLFAGGGFGFYRTIYSTAPQFLYDLLENLNDLISNVSPSITSIHFSPPANLPKKNSNPLVESVEISIDEVLHTRTGDLTCTLEHNGVTVTLISEAGGNGQNFISTLLSDDAEEPVGSGTAPFTGFYKPEQPLSAFKGMDPYGDWTLTITDGYAGNDGILNGWSLQIMLDSPILNNVEDDLSLPKDFALYQNYPNPFNPTTTIQFSLPQAGDVSLKIFNVLGEEVKTLADEYRQAGKHFVQFKAGNLASGIYFYRLQSGNFIETKKMILLR